MLNPNLAMHIEQPQKLGCTVNTYRPFDCIPANNLSSVCKSTPLLPSQKIRIPFICTEDRTLQKPCLPLPHHPRPSFHQHTFPAAIDTCVCSLPNLRPRGFLTGPFSSQGAPSLKHFSWGSLTKQFSLGATSQTIYLFLGAP
jgi:hypothetical protein